jgi:hypothetical protein
MGTATFSGPIRVGTQRDGAVTARNIGLVVLAQTAVVPFGAMTTSPTAQNLFTLPAGAKITNFMFETVTAISGGSVSAVAVTLGRTGTANAFVTSLAVPLTAIRQTQALVDAQFAAPACNNIGTTDVTVTGTFTTTGGNPTAGSVVVTVFYIQRLSDGTTGGGSGT